MTSAYIVVERAARLVHVPVGEGGQRQYACGVGRISAGRLSRTRHGRPARPFPKDEHANQLVLEDFMKETPDATNACLAERMAARTGISVSAATIRCAVNILGWIRKQRLVAREAEAPQLGTFLRLGEPGSGR